MTGLQEGNQYFLSTEDKNKKSVIFVKLTDSSVQSIERFLNSQDDSSTKPTIQFQNNSGIISLPQNGSKHNYGFTLSNIEGDKLQSSFQCLQHIDDSSLESLGFMFMKMQIHATEDSYEKTKCKMTAADLEQKNLCTKELRQNISRKGNKVSVKRPGLAYIPEKTQSSIIKPEPAKLNPKSKVTSPSTLIQQPIRERIIHILAAKPYKKAEILLRLKREGISDKDKDQITAILLEVAKLKGNIFVLENHMWDEVQEDWQFCSKEELQLIKKKKQQFIKTKNVNRVANLFKPFVKQKDALSTPETAGKPSNKKQKIAINGAQNNNKTSQNGSCATNSNTLTNGSSMGSTEISSYSHNASGNLNGSSHWSKQISALFSHTKDLPVDINNQALETQSSSYTPLLQTSFAPQERRIEERNGSSEEKMCIDVENNINEIDQHENETSSFITSSPVSVCEQTENGNVSKIQVKQSNNCSKINVSDSDSSGSLSVLDKIKLYKQLLNEDSPPPSHNKEYLAEHSSNWLKSKFLKPIHFERLLPFRRYITFIDSSSEFMPLTESAPEFDFSEIQQKYLKVVSLEQRSRYVQDFNKDYEEFITLQTQMKEISEKFSALFDRLHACIEGSLEFKRIKVEIGKEYKRTLKNNSYIASRKKFEFLKAKLSHIKEIVLDFDREIADEV